MGIICNGESLEEWQLRCVNDLLKLPYVRLKLLIIPKYSETKESRQQQPFSLWFYRIYRRYWFRNSPRRHQNIQSLFSHIHTVYAITLKDNKISIKWNADSIAAVQSYHLDFILNFESRVIHGEALSTARFGIWGFHHGDETRYRGAPAGFWEIYNNDPETGATLQKLTEKLDHGIILRRHIFKTVNYSYLKQIKNIYFKSAKWPQEVCEDIHEEKIGYFNVMPTAVCGKLYRSPNNLAMILFFLKLSFNKLRYLLLSSGAKND